MKGLVIAGAILAFLGLVGLAFPVFTTHQTKDVAKLGDLKLQNKEEATHVIPPVLSEGAIVVGAVLIGAGLYLKR